MQPNHVKRKLREGKTAIGTMVFEFASTGIARLAAHAGAEFILYDMEHTGFSVETIRALLATCPKEDITPLVRVPASQYHFLARVLDVGAMGIMVPLVESTEQADLIVRSTQFPPAGRRGAAFVIAHDDYAEGDVVAKMQSANEEVLRIVQIETARGLENVEQIAEVDGIDVLWIGQSDMTNALGIPGQFAHQKFHDAIERVVTACRKNGKTAGFMATSTDEAAERLEQGFRCLSYSGDSWLYQHALGQGIRAVRETIDAKGR